MNETWEKLAGEIAIYFQAYREECRFDPTIPDRSRDYAAKSITRIANAYAEGLPLPGEVGRTEIQVATRITSGLLAFFQTWVREAITQKKAKILIALRKEKKRRE